MGFLPWTTDPKVTEEKIKIAKEKLQKKRQKRRKRYRASQKRKKRAKWLLRVKEKLARGEDILHQQNQNLLKASPKKIFVKKLHNLKEINKIEKNWKLWRKYVLLRFKCTICYERVAIKRVRESNRKRRVLGVIVYDYWPAQRRVRRLVQYVECGPLMFEKDTKRWMREECTPDTTLLIPRYL